MGDSNKYTIGWICAITTEYVAAKAFLDKEHESLGHGLANDNNIYTLGEMGKHNVVIARLPKGEYGIAAAASVARDMVRTFSNIRIGLLVGIGGGAPSQKHDIRLGDVVVSAPHDGKGGLFQYDFGKTMQDQVFQTTGFLDQPPGLLRAAMGDIEAEHEIEGHQLDETINTVLEKRPRLRKRYKRPDFKSDRLYRSHIVHPLNDERSCEAVCGDNESNLIVRPDRSDEEDNPAIHYGLIASANQLMKDALIRDRLSAEKDVLCFEMEAAGLMNHFPCLIIRGICDYSDSHKNKEWQGYAAMTAAAYTKELLSRILPIKVEVEKRISNIFLDLQNRLENVSKNVKNVHTIVSSLARDTDHVAQNIDLEKLLVAEGAEFGTYMDQHEEECLPGTRRVLLDEIKGWASSAEGKSIFWLNGLAGTGKSTISRTTAKFFQETGLLGASFFFKRGEGDRGNATRFFPTITKQLLTRIPELKPSILKVLKDDPRISVKPLKEQFDKLFLQPLLGLENVSCQSTALVIVVDALDECDNDEDIKVVLQLMPRVLESKLVQLRVFVTSRPELPIRLGFEDIGHRNIVLHEIPEPIIKQDISLFLEYKLDEIRKRRSLVPDWPGNTNFQALLSMSIPLFIFASTICRLLQDHNLDPADCLTEILEYQNQESKLDGTYLPVFNRILVNYNEERKKKVAERIREVVGIIILLESPLPVVALAGLMGVTTASINSRLSSLHSVLSISKDETTPVRLYHLSLRDFLLDPKTSKNCLFWVDKTKTHKMITMKCLERMSESLQQNICSLENPGTLRTDIDSRIITQCLLPDVQYACRFWVYHLKESQTRIHVSDPVYVFLKDHLLHWLEALSLLGRIWESISLIEILRTLVNDEGMDNFSFLDDAIRYIRKNISIADHAPLQIYLSALIFTPETSLVRKMYVGNKNPNWVQRLPQVDSYWSGVVQTLEGHTGRVEAVVFSQDGRMIASASHDNTVKLWDSFTGKLQWTFVGHTDLVTIVAFSPDSKLLASGSHDRTIKLWDTATRNLWRSFDEHDDIITAVLFSGDIVVSLSDDETIGLWNPVTGERQQTFEDHNNGPKVVAISPDNTLVASGSSDHTVKLWDPAISTPKYILNGHSGSVAVVAFSSDGKLVASGSFDRSVKLWNTATGTLQKTLNGHSRCIQALKFSPCENFIASRSDDEEIKLWDLTTDSLKHTLEGHHIRFTVHLPVDGTNEFDAITFSPDGKLIASRLEDQTIQLWDSATGKLQRTFDDHAHSIRAIAFSRDGKQLISSSYDHTIKLWDPTASTSPQTIEHHSDSVTAITFSHDGELVASSSEDCIVKIWDPATGILQYNLLGHLNSVSDIIFSPNSKFIASSSMDGTVKLWDPASGTLHQTLTKNQPFNRAVAFSPDSSLLAFSPDHYQVTLYNTDAGTYKTLQCHTRSVKALSFSSIGNLLASSSEDGLIEVWNLASGTLLQSRKHHSRSVTAVAFSPDGKLLEADSIYFNSPTASVLHNDILLKNEWVIRNGTNIIWLPVEYRATCSAVYGSMIVLGHASGRVTFLKFV